MQWFSIAIFCHNHPPQKTKPFWYLWRTPWLETISRGNKRQLRPQCNTHQNSVRAPGVPLNFYPLWLLIFLGFDLVVFIRCCHDGPFLVWLLLPFQLLWFTCSFTRNSHSRIYFLVFAFYIHLHCLLWLLYRLKPQFHCWLHTPSSLSNYWGIHSTVTVEEDELQSSEWGQQLKKFSNIFKTQRENKQYFFLLTDS